jgi:hypothetical protein
VIGTTSTPSAMRTRSADSSVTAPIDQWVIQWGEAEPDVFRSGVG